METTMLTHAELLDLAGWTDRLGVLSVYVTVDPAEVTLPEPPWAVRVRHGIEAARQSWADGDAGLGHALESRLRDLGPTMGGLLDPKASGVGRALFLPLSRDAARLVALPEPVPDEVVLDTAARIHPLVAAWDAGRPAGLLVASRSGARLLEWRPRAATQVWTAEFAEHTGDWPRMTARAVSGTGRSYQMVPQRERFDRRVDANRGRFLADVAARVASQASRHGWGRLVLAGEPELTHRLRHEIHPAGRFDILELPLSLEHLGAAEIARRVTPALVQARRTRAETVARQARDAALSGGPGTIGVRDTLAVLAEGRVATLVLAGDSRWTGRRAPDQRLAVGGEDIPGWPASDLVSEPYLDERLLRQALGCDADIIFLDPQAAGVLADADGIAALLRW
jgi:hypothetical protein